MRTWEIKVCNSELGTERTVSGTSGAALDAYAKRLELLWECQAQREKLLANLSGRSHALDFQAIRIFHPIDEPPDKPDHPSFAGGLKKDSACSAGSAGVSGYFVLALLSLAPVPILLQATSYEDTPFWVFFCLMSACCWLIVPACRIWRRICCGRAYSRALKEYQYRLADWQQAFNEYETSVKTKQKEQEEFYDNLRDEWHTKSAHGVECYCEFVLIHNGTDLDSNQDHIFQYNEQSRILTVDLPVVGPDELSADFFRIRDVQFIKTRNDWKDLLYSAAESGRIYDDIVYKVVLRTLYVLFNADTIGALAAIILNGYVQGIDKATGHRVRRCILSIEVKRDEFMTLNLQDVDPKACFRRLRGIANPHLSTLTPVAPLARIERDDERFVNGEEVVRAVDDATNLAAMDWEDFEHLVREIFEKEFKQNGGEVRVTRASRDGGVDAIAFDPDPLRGGKIVIQAKRYTNTVGVNAVRDLYGTLINEGATKGILVTTSDYGPDAYEFAKGKPLTLLNGANLLYLLDRHGHRARINLKEAKDALNHGTRSAQRELWQ